MKRIVLFVTVLILIMSGCDISDDYPDGQHVDDYTNKRNLSPDENLKQENAVMIDGIEKMIVINGGPIQEILSAENDGSQKPESSVQQYEVTYMTKDGQEDFLLLRIETDETGKTIDVGIVDIAEDFSELENTRSEKANSTPIMESRCPDGCTFVCVHIWEKVWGKWIDYYKCFCIGGAHC